MPKVAIYNLEREKTAEIELKEEIFNAPVKKHLLHQVVMSQLSRRRAGSASTKGRSEVKASGTKLWRQKGTGRARVGGASSPTRRGGGVAFGPVPRKYVHKVSKKVRKAALRMALTDKCQHDRLVVVTDFDLPEIKTKSFVKIMKTFESRKTLIVTEQKNENLEKSSGNVPGVKVLRFEGLNVYDILTCEHLFLVQSAIGRIEEALIP